MVKSIQLSQNGRRESTKQGLQFKPTNESNWRLRQTIDLWKDDKTRWQVDVVSVKIYNLKCEQIYKYVRLLKHLYNQLKICEQDFLKNSFTLKAMKLFAWKLTVQKL